MNPTLEETTPPLTDAEFVAQLKRLKREAYKRWRRAFIRTCDYDSDQTRRLKACCDHLEIAYEAVKEEH